jgi:thiaminase/transcriptional activator TenA
MAFSSSLWQGIREVFGRILEHPFLQGLTTGTLEEEAFRFYVVQDALYLRDFARGLALLAAKAPEDAWVMQFAGDARDALQVERALHDSFFAHWGLTPDRVYATPPAPTTLLYTSYLLRVAYERPFHEGLGAFLPCYWIYLEVGKALEAKGSPNPLYQKWINTYASASYEQVVRSAIAVLDRVAEGLTPAQREAVRRHFDTTSRMEWMFWDMGWRREGWPV